MCLYGAGQLSSPFYTAQGTAQLQHVDLPLTWWPLSLLLTDLPPPIDGPACGFLTGGQTRWRLNTIFWYHRFCSNMELWVDFSFKEALNMCWNCIFRDLFISLLLLSERPTVSSIFHFFFFFHPRRAPFVSVMQCTVEQQSKHSRNWLSMRGFRSAFLDK